MLQGEREIGALTRRELVGRGLAVAALAAVPSLVPARRAAAAAARPRFASSAQLRAAQEMLDDIGLRAPGTAVHDRYVDALAGRLERAGVRDVRTEAVPLKRWEPTQFKLEVVGGDSVPVASYIPYSGRTPATGVTAPLTIGAPIGGSVALFDVAPTPLVSAAFDAGDYGTPQHPPGYNPAKPYDRPWVAALQIPSVLETLRDAGAVAAIGILPLPADAAKGSYFPYDGVHRGIPALYVDRETGDKLRRVALAGGSVRLTLGARVDDVTTPNLIGLIPGRSSELVILHSHTDGTNGIEDNGGEAIVAMSRYLRQLDLARSVLVVLSTGHMAGHALGAEAFIERHRDDLIERTAAAITVEHLGAKEWLAGADGRFRLTGEPEEGVFFASPNDAVIDPARASMHQADILPDRVMKPFFPDQGSPNWVAWPGDGEGFWALAGLPSANFIAGPTYLLNAGMKTVDKTDFALFRRQAIAFSDLVAELGRRPLEELRQRRVECTTCTEEGT